MEPVRKPSRFLLSAVCLLLSISCAHAEETIVAIRHAEKPPASLGQLTCKGLNRALALPKVLIPRYGKPDRIYAPDPGRRIGRVGNLSYSYVRPLMTIEPTAVQLEMPVNALIGFKNVGQLRKELLAAENTNSVIYLAWEHVYLNQFAKRLLEAYGKDPSVVPDWPNDEYDRIYVFRIKDVGSPPSPCSHSRSASAPARRCSRSSMPSYCTRFPTTAPTAS